jgi:hypothetical protein
VLFESEGDLLLDFAEPLEIGNHLIVMPIARVNIEWDARMYPGPVVFYPPAAVDLGNLNIVANRTTSSSLAEYSSAASGVDESIFRTHSLVAFPYALNWSEVRTGSHSDHREIIRRLSQHVDTTCLNFVRYMQCPIDLPDCLPARAGQLDSNHMMAGALLYSHVEREARLIGGDSFTHFITRGLGLPIASIAHSSFPKTGELGRIVSHALMLYRDILEASSPTSQYVQCLSLLEFLVEPDSFCNFDKVRKVVARYIAANRSEYNTLLDRLFELTGKRDETTGRYVGYRTRIVHIGDRVEDIVPGIGDRKSLFLELDGYIKRIIDHMIVHSEKTFTEYLSLRESLRPFEIGP